MKSIMFKTKIFHEVKMYLLVSDVTKMMEISEKAFCKKYSDKIVEIPGCRKCIAETDFNLLISSIFWRSIFPIAMACLIRMRLRTIL